eukprot:6212981-Pleurochrysis_carterae.AAC.8
MQSPFVYEFRCASTGKRNDVAGRHFSSGISECGTCVRERLKASVRIARTISPHALPQPQHVSRSS